MVVLHLPKHSPVAHDLVLPPAWACHLPFSPYLPSCDHLCTPATSELLRAGFFLFPRKSSSSPEGRCQAHFWSPTFPESCGCYPPPRASENGRCISGSTTPHEGPREESVGSDFAQSVYLCGGLPKEGVSALSSHATSFLYYLPKFQPMCFLTIKYYLIEVCVPPQLFPPLSLRGHVIFDCVSPDFNNESEIGLTNLVNPDEQRNQLFCCCCCFVFLLWN